MEIQNNVVVLLSAYRGVVDMMKGGCGMVKEGLLYGVSCLSPSNIHEKYRVMKGMTWKELLVGLCKLNYNVILALLSLFFTVIWLVQYNYIITTFST